MVFKRKKYKDLLEWKEKYAGRYSLLIEGARRVGKSTLVETFSRNEYKSSIIIDFANVSQDIMECFRVSKIFRGLANSLGDNLGV